MLDIAELAKYLNLAEQTVRNRSREIPGRKKFGRKVVFDRQVIDRWLSNNDGTRDLWLDARRMMR